MKEVQFGGKLVVLGCGLIGQGVLPLIFRYIDIRPDQVSIITSDNRGHEVAAYYEVPFSINALTPGNYQEILGSVLGRGDFLLNLSSDVESNWLIDYCAEQGVLYLDTCIDSWLGESTDSTLSVSRRSLYALREQSIALRKKWGGGGGNTGHCGTGAWRESGHRFASRQARPAQYGARRRADN